MRSKIAQRILNETPKEIEVFVRLYADLTVRINQILKQKNMSQKDLADLMQKKPSEISKWLKGEHNFTLRSIAKLQAELDEELISIPKQHAFTDGFSRSTQMTVYRSKPVPKTETFEKYKLKPINRTAHAS